MTETKARILGMIPAKGGSTRLARKNVATLGGKSLLEWTVDVARDCGLMDRLVLSTEDHGIADVGRELGLDVPFLRPDHLARDPAGVDDVAMHMVTELEKTGDHFDEMIYLLPTCPFRGAEDILAGYQLFKQTKADYLISVAEFEHTPFAALSVGYDYQLNPIFPEHFGKKSQNMPLAVRPNGAFHIFKVDAFKKAGTSYPPGVVGYQMSRERSIDIDTTLDLALAEAMLARGPVK